MPTNEGVTDRIRSLSDKEACCIVKGLTEEIFSAMQAPPSFDELECQVGTLAQEAGVCINLRSGGEWYATELPSDASGTMARLLLEDLAKQDEMKPLVAQALDRYSDETLDLGIISAGIAIAMVYVAISSDLDIDLGWFKLKKKGMTGEQQKETVVKTLPELVKVFPGGTK